MAIGWNRSNSSVPIPEIDGFAQDCFSGRRGMGQIAEGFRRHVETSLLRLTESEISPRRRLALLWLFGCIALAITTWLCFRLGVNSATAGYTYLIVIVLLSLLDSFISSAVFSVVAVACLDFFFIEPRFTFEVAYAEDLLALVTFVVTSLAVTGLVRRMRTLAGAHREQARLLDLTHDSVVVRDVSDAITYWNRGAEELYGWKREDAVGKTAHQLLQTKFPIPLEEITRVLLRTGRWEGELLNTKRDGTPVAVESRWSLQQGSDERPLGTLETNNDITQRKRAEEALRRSQAAYLAEAQKLSTTGSFGWNVSTGDIFWSEETFRIFGYDSVVTPSIEALLQRVHPEDAALVKDTIERAAKEKREFDVEHRLLMPNGAVKHLHLVAHVMTDEPDNLQFVGAAMDVSAAKQAQERLQQAQAELAYVTRVTTLGELTASIAHEVNQPLAAIVTFGEAGLRFLARDPPHLDEVRDALKRVIGDGKRAAEIVQHIRALTRRSEPRTGRVDLNEVLGEAVILVQREMASNRVALRQELAPGLPGVLGDRIQLQQVVINLMINAIQAMAAIDDRPRELVIRSRRDDAGEVLVSVQDAGVGIDPGNAARLFDAFFTTKPTGMGMGLSICSTIIEAHGGRVWASSNAGPGATFLFSLPAIQQDAP
jgi:PAS domain S-box-containing protein